VRVTALTIPHVSACVRNVVCWVAEVCRDHVHTYKQTDANIIICVSVEFICATFRHALYFARYRIKTFLCFIHRNAGHCKIIKKTINANYKISNSENEIWERGSCTHVVLP
jgi:hypothetical protein